MITAGQYLQPDVARRVRRLDLRAKFIVEGFLAGLNDSPYRGFSPDFCEHRNYVLGDDPKDLDWTKWARTDRLYVKTFQAETNLEAYVCVDTSRSMAFTSRPGAMTKLEYATALAAALGYLLTRQRDAVGLALLGSDLTRLVRPRVSRRQLARVLAELAQAVGNGPTRLAPALHALARRARHRSLMLIMSDLVDEPQPVLEALRHLAFRGHDLVVFQILDAAERRLDMAGPVILEDPETGMRVSTDADHIRAAYVQRVEEFVETFRRGVGDLGGDFVAMTTTTPFDKALCRFLADRKRRF
jgi:uncharacterized protein (DUF58 family)